VSFGRGDLATNDLLARVTGPWPHRLVGRSFTRSHYVGVFDDRNDAELAARDLREKGFKDEQIGYAWRDESGKTHAEGNKAGSMAASGAGTGVVLGGLIGAGAALLIPGIGPIVSGGLLATALAGGVTGAVTGAVAGGVAGALVGLGIPEVEAKYYDQQFRDGRTLMTVRADDRYGDASDIVRRRKGYDYETRNDRVSETPPTEVRR